jgi:raffinose/stachyose/melibiose transport system permease protein
MTVAHDAVIESRAPRRKEWRYIGLVLFAIPWIFLPFWMVLVNSLKTEGEASQLSAAWPSTWAVAENFATVLDQGTYLVGLRNSLLIAVPTILAILLLGSMAAWTYARSSSFSLRFAYFATILSIVLPPAIIPTLFVLQKFGLDGERLGYILVLIATRLGIVVFLTTGFIRAIPRDMEEAAELDGASHWQIYRHVILPMIAPVLVVSGVILIINVWNDFYYALFMLQGASNNTLPLTLYQFASNSMTTVRWNLVFAHVLLTSLPLIIAYIFLQRRVVAGLTEGGVKG